jgi:putative ABC transport system substrate-binding protein
MSAKMKRRNFIALLGGAAAWPLTARAQWPATPVIGFVSSGSPQADAWRLDAFRRALNEAGYTEGRNVKSEFRWADDRYDRLAGLAAELVRSQPALLVALGVLPPRLPRSRQPTQFLSSSRLPAIQFCSV